MVHRAVERFSEWFESSTAVWQTLAVCFAIVIVEFADPGLDPHFFWVLFWLTVYSAVTQPALAYAARRAAELVRQVLAAIHALVAQILALVEEVRRLVDEIRSLAERSEHTQRAVLELARDVRGLAERIEALAIEIRDAQREQGEQLDGIEGLLDEGGAPA